MAVVVFALKYKKSSTFEKLWCKWLWHFEHTARDFDIWLIVVKSGHCGDFAKCRRTIYLVEKLWWKVAIVVFSLKCTRLLLNNCGVFLQNVHVQLQETCFLRRKVANVVFPPICTRVYTWKIVMDSHKHVRLFKTKNVGSCGASARLSDVF